MKILAIETSCDDTCAAILEIRGQPPGESFASLNPTKLETLSNIISSQIKIHRKYGGVYPSLAKREHQKNLVPVLFQSLKGAKLLRKLLRKSKGLISQNLKLKLKTLKEILKREETLYKQLEKFLAKYKKPKIDLIAVTAGPGLEPCLWVGVNFVKALAFFWNLPIVPINHIEAHILASLITRPELVIQFPAICLVVSGGHTQLILMRGYGKYKILGETRDDAAGECFDKVARILGMAYPGGPAIEAKASKFQIPNVKFQIKLPRPMIRQKNFDFSFSGLKTAVLYNFKKQPPKIRTSKEYIQEMSAEVQQAIIDVLIEKTLRAAKKYKAEVIFLGGGVVANNELRNQFKNACLTPDVKHLDLIVPPKVFCTDNAVMVAVAGFSHWLKGEEKNWAEIKAEANIKIC